MSSLALERIAGENATEIVYTRAYRDFRLFLKHEYPAAPYWEWILCQGQDPIAFGEAATEEEAAAELATVVGEYCPELQQPDAGDAGILRIFARAVRAAWNGVGSPHG